MNHVWESFVVRLFAKEPEEINDSCKNLKLNGESRSRNYALNDGSLSFCDMTKRVTDGDIQKKIGDFRFKEPM